MANFIEHIELSKKTEAKFDKVSAKLLDKPKYKVTIDTESIIGTIEKYKNQYFNTTAKINRRELDENKMEEFLEQTQKALSFLSMVYDDNVAISHILEFDFTKNKREKDRVSISPQNIFETGIDVAIYGGAGVGKTTTLVSYATQLSKIENTLVIYTPLNKIVEDIKKFTNDEQNKKKFLQDLISNLILLSNGIAPSQKALQELSILNNQRSVVILDGLDEVYSVIPEIVTALSEFKEKFTQVQLIVSSRDCVSYIQDIKFLGDNSITLHRTTTTSIY